MPIQRRRPFQREKKDTNTFKKRMDFEDPDSLKLLYEVVICADTDPESILKHDQ